MALEKMMVVMIIRPFFLLSFLLLSIGLTIACQSEIPPEPGEMNKPEQAATIRQDAASLNLVSLADLQQTVRIDVLRRHEGDESTPANFEQLFTLSEIETIHMIVASLDKDLELGPHARCPALYTLIFHLADGKQHEFGYACEMASPSFLRGGQVFWQGVDVIAPDAFNGALSAKLRDAGMEAPFHQ